MILYLMRSKYKIIIVIGMFLVLGWGASFFLRYIQGEYYLAVIPHFMIAPARVQHFYSFLKKQYFPAWKSPDQIVLLSPNHFFPKQKKLESICFPERIKFKNQIISVEPFPKQTIDCQGGVFYFKGEQKYTKDHGLGEHFRWINQFFPTVQKIYLLALPTHHMEHAPWLAKTIQSFSWRTLVIASVDFSHYFSEPIAQEHDQISFETLQKNWAFQQLRALDVDCPACLGVVYLLAEAKNLSLHQWLRDSSSTLVGKDLKEENTSRQFLWWE